MQVSFALVGIVLTCVTASARAQSGWMLRATGVPPARNGTTMAWDSAHGVCVMFGGVGAGNELLGDTWSWDGAAWTVVPGDGPSARSYARLAYDEARGVFVLFGGRTDNTAILTSAETWELGSAGWTLRTSGGDHPGPRYVHGMAYDAARHVTVMFGGLTDAGDPSDGGTWEWDGVVWNKVADTGPTARQGAGMCFDRERGVTVMFGGQEGASSLVLSDTWEWTGRVWVQRTPATNVPTSRSYHAITFDEAHRVTILYGGYDPSVGQPYEDTWVWDGHDWTPRNIAGPGPRTGHALAFDAARGKAVLYAGNTFSAEPTAETWELELPLPCVADINQDGFVSGDDFDTFLDHFEAGC